MHKIQVFTSLWSFIVFFVAIFILIMIYITVCLRVVGLHLYKCMLFHHTCHQDPSNYLFFLYPLLTPHPPSGNLGFNLKFVPLYSLPSLLETSDFWSAFRTCLCLTFWLVSLYSKYKRNHPVFTFCLMTYFT